MWLDGYQSLHRASRRPIGYRYHVRNIFDVVSLVKKNIYKYLLRINQDIGIICKCVYV